MAQAGIATGQKGGYPSYASERGVLWLMTTKVEDCLSQNSEMDVLTHPLIE
jgi:hypothetical protein